jgi:hypothetical protein
MSTVIAELYDALREAGASDDKARAAAAAVIGAEAEDRLATKADIVLLRSEFKADNALLRSEFKADNALLRSEFKADNALLRSDFETQRNSIRADIEAFRLANKADLSELRAELIKWNVGTIIATAAVFAAVVKLL